MSPRSFFSCLVSSLVLCAANFAATPPTPALGSTPVAEALSPITSVADAFARWPELDNDLEPVRLEGVVTGTMPSGAFRLHDGELGIYVTKSPAGEKLTAGDRVIVNGVLRKGGFSPWISPRDLTRIGRGPFPEARPASYSVLASGAVDNQWVEIEGVVRDAQVHESRDFVVLDLGMSGGNLRAWVNYEDNADLKSLVDASVRLRGIAAVNVNAQQHVVEPSFRVPSFAEITVLKPGQPAPFEQALVPVKGLMRFSLGTSPHHRVRTRGVVTRRLSETTFFVRDGEFGLKVESKTAQHFKPGDVIEAAGFPVMADGMAVLQHAVCRSVGMASPPTPIVPTLATLLEGTYNSDLVQMQARLVDWVVAGQNLTLVFQTGNQLFKGLFNVTSPTPLVLPEKDSLVNVTGICVISELEDIWFYQPRSFVLLLADLMDLQLVQAPPWWTPERLWRALTVSCLVLFAVAAWVWALRRQIHRKRAVIEQQARHTAALEERSRIARELHDTLEQGLTGLSLQMKAMETDLNTTPHPVRKRLECARQMLRQSRALARNAIRELRSEAVPFVSEGLIEGLKRVAESWRQSGALSVTLDVVGNPHPLPPSVENHLVGIGTEAMTNAVKHGRAKAIHVTIVFRAAEVVVCVKDNGVGFDPERHLGQTSGCFGLLGMRERAREVRGELHIRSQPGQGAEVTVTAPIPSAPETAVVRRTSADPGQTLRARSPA